MTCVDIYQRRDTNDQQTFDEIFNTTQERNAS